MRNTIVTARKILLVTAIFLIVVTQTTLGDPTHFVWAGGAASLASPDWNNPAA